VRYSGWD